MHAGAVAHFKAGGGCGTGSVKHGTRRVQEGECACVRGEVGNEGG